MTDQPVTPGASELSDESQRSIGALVHAIPAVLLVLSAGTLGLVSSIVVYVLYQNKGAFVRRQAANSVNIQITTFLLLAVSGLLMLVLIGFVLYPIVIVWAVVLHVIGAKRSNDGEWWNPPLTPRLLH